MFAYAHLASETIGWETIHSNSTMTKTAYVKDTYDPTYNPSGTFKPKIKSKVLHRLLPPCVHGFVQFVSFPGLPLPSAPTCPLLPCPLPVSPPQALSSETSSRGSLLTDHIPPCLPHAGDSVCRESHSRAPPRVMTTVRCALEKPRQVKGKVQHAGPGGARLSAWSQQTNSIRFSCWVDTGQRMTVVFQ